MERIGNFIGGEEAPAAGGGRLPVDEPAHGRPWAEVADSGPADVERAVQAAADAFPAWSRTPAAERCRLLLVLADRIEADLEAFAVAEARDTGKPIRLARTLDIPRAVANLRHFATAILHTHSELHATDSTALNYTVRRPRGVAGVISPWNLPLYLLTWKVAPALATGNTVVAKPSEVTPMTAAMLGRACRAAGLPPGVLNIVHGTGPAAGAPLVAHPLVPTLSFTGGTATGAGIARTAAPMFKRLALEMGGKNPNIVFADADLDAALAGSARAGFANQGQICLSGSRLLVQDRIADAFVESLASAARALRIGDPLDEATEHGALVSRAQYDKVTSYLELARRESATFVCGGGRPADLPERLAGGYFLEPTVLTGPGPDSRLNREEIFGPVVTVQTFHDEDEALRLANAVDYGLSASVWTRDLSRAHRVAAALEAGTVWVNCWLLRDLRVPFGGVKQSGVGREGGDEALRFYTEPKNICVRTPDQEDAP